MVQTTISEKNKKFQNRKIKNSRFLHIRVRVRVKDEKSGIFPDTDAVKYQMMLFKPIFSPVERKIPIWWCNCPPRRF